MNRSAGDFDELPCQAAADPSSHLTLEGFLTGHGDGSVVSHYSYGTSGAERSGSFQAPAWGALFSHTAD